MNDIATVCLSWHNDMSSNKGDTGVCLQTFASCSYIVDEMYLQLQSKSRFLDLHLTSGLHDWDMNEEIKLTTTTDQFYHGKRLVFQWVVCEKEAFFSVDAVWWFGRWEADWPVSGAVALREDLQKIFTRSRSRAQELPAAPQQRRCVQQA